MPSRIAHSSHLESRSSGDGLRLACLVGLMVAFDATFTLRAVTEGRGRIIAGCMQSAVFLGMLGIYGWVGTREGRRDRVSGWWMLGAGTGLLVLNLVSNHLSGILAVVYRPAPVWVVVATSGGWLGLLVVARRRGVTPGLVLVALLSAVVVTRVIGLTLIPFHRLSGDMLGVIDLGLADLFEGRFPYRNYPPPMPYFPLTFLAYAPSKMLGIDLRWTNVVSEAVAVWVAFGLGRKTTQELSWPQVALPLLMLNPTWTYLSVDTHYSPSVLAAMVLGRVLAGESMRWQAMGLGLAVGTNQSFVVFGPILASGWVRRAGWTRGLRLSGAAAAVTGVLVTPWLVWDAEGFVRTTLLFRVSLPPEVMEGRMSLLPAMRAMGAGWMATGAIVGVVVVAMASAWRVAGRPMAVVAALGYAGVLMFLGPVTFPHYFLPAMALVACAGVDAPEQLPDTWPPEPEKGTRPLNRLGRMGSVS